MNFIKAVISANLEIYNLLKNTNDTTLKQKFTNGFGGDISIKADLEAEKIFIKYLSSFGVIYSEESGIIGSGDDTIVIDPLDGSDNFCCNIPYFGTSVARKTKNETTDAIITNLSNGDIFAKDLNGFKKYSLFNDCAQDIVKNKHSNIGIFEREYSSKKLSLLLKNQDIKYRSLGAFAISLSLCYEVDFILFDGKTREFDIAAGWKMAENLYRYKDEKYLLVSKDKVNFDRILQLIKQQGE